MNEEDNVFEPRTLWTFGGGSKLGLCISVAMVRLPRARCPACGMRRVLFGLSAGSVAGPTVCARCAGIR